MAAFVLATTTALVVVVLLVAELGARFFAGGEALGALTGHTVQATAVHHPELGWVNLPGVSTRIESPAFTCTVSINSKGLRDREHDYAKPPGTFRIALLGDSVAWGWGVDDGLAFADLVERQLGPEVEVVNLAVPGYSTDQELRTLETEGMRYDPDLVLLCFVLNDVNGNESLRGHGMPYAKPRYEPDERGELVLAHVPVPLISGSARRRSALGSWLQGHSALFRRLFSADEESDLARASRDAQLAADEDRAPTGSGDAPEPKPVRRGSSEEREKVRSVCDRIADGESLTYQLLARIRDRCAERGIPLVAFGVCHHHDRYLYAAGVETPAGAFEQAEYTSDLARRLAQAGEALGFATFSVDDAMLRGVAEHGDLHCGDGHLNALGNRIVAERVSAELRRFVAPR